MLQLILASVIGICLYGIVDQSKNIHNSEDDFEVVAKSKKRKTQ